MAGVVLSSAGQDGDEVIRVSAENVAVPVSVLDRSGRYISTLKQGDFRIFEDGVEQEITSFETTESSLTVIMLIERTGMIGLQLPRVVAAANAFVRQMRPEDTLMAMTFGSDSEIVIDRTKVKDSPKGIKVGRTSVDKFGTRLFGTVDQALKAASAVKGRKAIVLFSEGHNTDRYSTKTAKGTIKDAEESEATVYTIKFGPPGQFTTSSNYPKWYQDRMNAARDYMSGLATKTGGRMLEIEKIEDLDRTFADIAGEVVKQYTLGYSPIKPAKEGERRRIKVQAAVPEAVIRARKEVFYRKALR